MAFAWSLGHGGKGSRFGGGPSVVLGRAYGLTMPAPRPCVEHRCPAYAVPGKSRCATHEARHEAKRRADPGVTGRRGTSPEWRRARGLCLYRFKHTCQGCGRTLPQIVALDGKLEVHHKDGDSNNNAQGNLEPLCTLGCHRHAGRLLRESGRPDLPGR